LRNFGVDRPGKVTYREKDEINCKRFYIMRCI